MGVLEFPLTLICNFQLEPELWHCMATLYLLLRFKSVKTFPSALAKMVASFIKVDTIPRLFLKILKKKIR